jgi:hypothetical protein
MRICAPHKFQVVKAVFCGLCLLFASLVVPQTTHAKEKGNGATAVLWIDHLDLVPGDVDVQTSFNSTTSGVGSGLSGLIIKSTTTGDVSTSGGNKVVEKGVQVPPGFSITGVRICYQLSDAGANGSFIDQIRLAQLQDPPSTALVLLDDGTPQNASGPVCANSVTAASPINPADGAVRLSLRVKFGSVNDKIVLRGLALNLVKTTKKASKQDEDDQ